ncbi:uncharacterized protein GGS22DRAFT_84149 [Annulohypoxylon maeteangense]|uniref:uncharacterized protein n=1 Tax=Annulohypoxylon maeteangense TaxID=1927788 RepID=UPI0020073A22|nr:uncharacterized protein GGS22DRAFT_84149 [Annulohypoxylon maeteangense]KAI0880463.1 hypothetical protein GGS22DRAFT_84149 [Annulohypoxylon maeteangense]
MSLSLDNFPNLSPKEQQEILQGAALKPPNGVISNFKNPPNGNAWGLFIIVFCLFMTTVAGLMRLYSRFILKKAHVEDYLGLLAYAAFVGCAGNLFAIYHISGFFVHQWNVRLVDYLDIAEILIIFTICYCLTMTFAKPAILLEWIRIFVPHRERNSFYWVAWVLIVTNVMLYFSATIATIFNCTPPKKSWEPWVEGICSNRRALDVGVAFFNLAIDTFILALPQKIIWRLQMTMSRRIGVATVFSVGVLACGCAIGRLYYNWIAEYSGQGDTTYSICALFFWAFGELSCVLLVFFVPCIPKAIGENRIHKLASLLNSQKSNKESSKSRRANFWPPTIGNVSVRPREYRAMGDGGTSVVSLSELEPRERTEHRRGANIDVEVAFSKTSEEAHQPSTYQETEIVERQHPWMRS